MIAAFRVGPFGSRVPYRVEAPFTVVLAGQVVRGRIDAVYETATDRRADDIRNIILVATERAAPGKERLAEIWEEVRQDRAPNAPDLSAPAANRWERDVPTGDVPLLTDGYAPTDALLLG